MAWEGSNRKHELPPDWAQRRIARFELDNWTCVDCGWRDTTGRTLECDHLDRDDHRIERLRTRCGRRSPNNCHGRKSARQGGQAGARMRRPVRRHPGLLSTALEALADRTRRPRWTQGGGGPPPPPAPGRKVLRFAPSMSSEPLGGGGRWQRASTAQLS